MGKMERKTVGKYRLDKNLACWYDTKQDFPLAASLSSTVLNKVVVFPVPQAAQLVIW